MFYNFIDLGYFDEYLDVDDEVDYPVDSFSVDLNFSDFNLFDYEKKIFNLIGKIFNFADSPSADPFEIYDAVHHWKKKYLLLRRLCMARKRRHHKKRLVKVYKARGGIRL